MNLNIFKSARTLVVALFAFAACNVSFVGDMNNKDLHAGMFSKVYWTKVDPAKADAMFEHFDTVVVPMVKESEYHGGLVYQWITTEPGQ